MPAVATVEDFAVEEGGDGGRIVKHRSIRSYKGSI